jgi:cbb3-type cytochrome oxidase maturation protein
MSVIYVLLPVALLLAALALIAFIWAVRQGQFDDLDTPPLRLMHDDEPVRDENGPGASPSHASTATTPNSTAEGPRVDD